MTKEQPPKKQATAATAPAKSPTTAIVGNAYRDDVSPDSLMGDFRGRPLIGILAFTVIVHVVLIGVFSAGYLKNELLGKDTSALTEEERLDIAVREATSSLRDIAKRHGVNAQDFSSRFSEGKSRDTTTSTPANPSTADTGQPTGEPGGQETPGATKEPGSEIEKTLNQKADGPELPDLDDDDDLFK